MNIFRHTFATFRAAIFAVPLVIFAACEPVANEMYLRQLSSGPAGAGLSLDTENQIATLAVGTVLAIDCDEYVDEYYRSECESLLVISEQPSLSVRPVYRPRTDDSLSSTSAFALIGMAPGNTMVHITTAYNSFDLSVQVRP
jgi:hypothetical protein